MALLNFAKSILDINSKLSIDVLKLLSTDTNNYPKLFFTEDGHIITHGRDYTRLFGKGISGLVNGSILGSTKEFLRGNNTWANITVADLPMWTSGTGTSTTLYTSAQVDLKIKDGFSANDAMRFKGTITKTSTGYTATGFEGTFPTKCEVGDTYRVTSAGVYAGQKCSPGDLMICIKDGKSGNLNISEYWTIVESNINGTVTHTINGNKHTVYSNDTSTFTIYAPTSAGSNAQILTTDGSTLSWVNRSSIIAGDIIDSAKLKLFTALSLSTGGVLSMTIGGTTKSQTATGTWGINITGNAVTATKVKHALSIKGNGLKLSSNFDGSEATTLNLIPATISSLGGVSVDSGKRDASDILKPTISVSGEGMIYLTAENISNALGYTPENSAKSADYTVILSDGPQSTNPVTTNNPYLNLIKKLPDGSQATSSAQFKGGVGISIKGSGNIVGFNLIQASSEILGGIKIGYGSNSQNYALQLNSDGQAFVNVPWKNTTYGIVTKSSNGLAPMFNKSAGVISKNLMLLASNGTTPNWYTLPDTAFKDTWRPVYFGESSSIGNKTLRILPGKEIYLKTDLEGDNFADISFGLAWYNVSEDKYEMTN